MKPLMASGLTFMALAVVALIFAMGTAFPGTGKAALILGAMLLGMGVLVTNMDP